MRQKHHNVLLVLAVLTSVLAVVSAGFTFYSLSNLVSKISGYATTTVYGEVNITVESFGNINFTTATNNFGSGRVAAGRTGANLITVGSGTVTGGNWTAVTGLRLENIGNVNITLNLTANQSAANWIGGTSPVFLWNISSVEAGSCVNSTSSSTTTNDIGLNTNVFFAVNTSTTVFCSRFNYIDASDLVRIDFNLTIPSDSKTGASLSNLITATADTTLYGP